MNNTKLERTKKRKLSDVEKDEEVVQSVVSLVKATRSICGRYNPQSQCFFCEEADSLENLHAASTKEVDKKVRECAGLLNDGKLIAKLSGGDLIAIDAKYHSKCLAGLYNRARSYRLQAIKPSVHPLCEPNELAFAQLLAYIEEQLETEEPILLTLSDLVKFYMCKLRELFGKDCGTVNLTHLKERILDVFPDLTAHTKDRNQVHLVLKHEIGGILSNSGKNIDSDACCLARAAHIVRREVLDVKNSFNGQFQEGCQKHSVPHRCLRC